MQREGCAPSTHGRLKPLLRSLQRLTNPRYLLTSLPKLGFVQERSVLTTLPRVVTVLATLLLAIVGVSAGANSAAAHGNHVHRAATSSPSSVALPAPDSQQLEVVEAAISGDAVLPTLPQKHSKSDCCCASIMCHAGVAHTIDIVPLGHPAGARVIAEPTTGQPLRNESGLERPPRTTDIA